MRSRCGASRLDLRIIAALVGKIQAFIDPVEAAKAPVVARGAEDSENSPSAGRRALDAGPVSLAEADRGPCGHCRLLQPSGTFEPDVAVGTPGPSAHRQVLHRGHQHPGSYHMEKAAFQIGSDQVFELPSRQSFRTCSATPRNRSMGPVQRQAEMLLTATGTVAVARLQVQIAGAGHRLARSGTTISSAPREPSSPVPMLCERARAFAERDFMAVLRDVLPKAALKDIGADK